MLQGRCNRRRRDHDRRLWFLSIVSQHLTRATFTRHKLAHLADVGTYSTAHISCFKLAVRSLVKIRQVIFYFQSPLNFHELPRRKCGLRGRIQFWPALAISATLSYLEILVRCHDVDDDICGWYNTQFTDCSLVLSLTDGRGKLVSVKIHTHCKA